MKKDLIKNERLKNEIIDMLKEMNNTRILGIVHEYIKYLNNKKH